MLGHLVLFPCYNQGDSEKQNLHDAHLLCCVCYIAKEPHFSHGGCEVGSLQAADSEDLMLQLDCKAICLETSKPVLSMKSKGSFQETSASLRADQPFHSVPTHVMKADLFT